MHSRRLAGDELRADLEEVTAALVTELAPERIILFGSFARGDQNRASDLDLVVIAETTLAFCERIGRALEACYRASPRLAVEALVYTPAEWDRMRESASSFVELVEREGRTLHDSRSQSARSRALAHAGAPRS